MTTMPSLKRTTRKEPHNLATAIAMVDEREGSMCRRNSYAAQNAGLTGHMLPVQRAELLRIAKVLMRRADRLERHIQLAHQPAGFTPITVLLSRS